MWIYRAPLSKFEANRQRSSGVMFRQTEFTTLHIYQAAPIFYFSCEYFLFVYIEKKRLWILKKIRGFLIFDENQILLEANFQKLIICIYLPWGHVRSHTKFGLGRFSRFDVYWIQICKQTNKQIDTQAQIKTE